MLFDDFVLPEETELRLDLHGVEVDYDPRYGVLETVSPPYYDDMGGGSLTVSTLQSGTYSFSASDWSCQLSVTVVDYPFTSSVGVGEPSPPRPVAALAIAPNPFGSTVRIVAPAATRASAEVATLEIADVRGRRVRRIEGLLGQTFVWDGRDAEGRPQPAGIYLYRVRSASGSWDGKSCLLR